MKREQILPENLPDFWIFGSFRHPAGRQPASGVYSGGVFFTVSLPFPLLPPALLLPLPCGKPHDDAEIIPGQTW